MSRKLVVLGKPDIFLGEFVSTNVWTRLKTLAWGIKKSRLVNFDRPRLRLRLRLRLRGVSRSRKESHKSLLARISEMWFVFLINPLPLNKQSLCPSLTGDVHLCRLTAYLRDRSTIPSNVQAPTKLTMFGWRPT